MWSAKAEPPGRDPLSTDREPTHESWLSANVGLKTPVVATMHLGYFADFKSGEALLMEADIEGLQELRGMFQALAAGRIRRVILHRLPFVQVHHAVELRASSGPEDPGVRRDGAGNSFLWERSRDGWRDAAEKLTVLIEDPNACHHYLRAEQDDVDVVVSKGEYGDTWWARQ